MKRWPDALASRTRFFRWCADSLIAVALHDGAPDRARAAWGYALAPVPVIIVAIQGQWDALFLYPLMVAFAAARLESVRGDAIAGCAWLISVIVKPVTLPLLILFVPAPWRIFDDGPDGSRSRGRALASGIVAGSVVYLSLLAIIGQPMSYDEIPRIVVGGHTRSHSEHGS